MQKEIILGDIDRGEVEGYFAANAVKNKTYTGLSLQHISCTMSDGTHTKIPVEVSLCEEPRRPDCRVRSHTASAKTPYIRLCEQLAKMAEQTTTTHIASAELYGSYSCTGSAISGKEATYIICAVQYKSATAKFKYYQYHRVHKIYNTKHHAYSLNEHIAYDY